MIHVTQPILLVLLGSQPPRLGRRIGRQPGADRLNYQDGGQTSYHRSAPDQTAGDINLTPQRKRWIAPNLDNAARAAPVEDTR